jgi:hypothetical protein
MLLPNPYRLLLYPKSTHALSGSTLTLAAEALPFCVSLCHTWLLGSTRVWQSSQETSWALDSMYE